VNDAILVVIRRIARGIVFSGSVRCSGPKRGLFLCLAGKGLQTKDEDDGGYGKRHDDRRGNGNQIPG